MDAPNGEQLGIYAQIRIKGVRGQTKTITLNWLTQSEALALLRAANLRSERKVQRLIKVPHRKAG